MIRVARGTGRPPRLAFVGTGWIGRHRLEAVLAAGVAEVVAVVDPFPEAANAAAALAPGAVALESHEQLLQREDLDLDGVVIATPSALHAEQSLAALRHGCAVFCQKPLGRTAAEVRAIVDAASAVDRRLGADFCYRELTGISAVRDLVRAGELGRVYAIEAEFHNAYGPDKAWFRDPAASGGGCVMDLGVHLVDLACWLLDFPTLEAVTSHLFANGAPLRRRGAAVEDYGAAGLELEGGALLRLACSWNLPAGVDAVIGCALFGTQGGAALRNVNGSFYDFEVERFRGTTRERIAGPPDAWGGRAIVAWARALATDAGFDPCAENFVHTAAMVDAIYDAAEDAPALRGAAPPAPTALPEAAGPAVTSST